MSPRAIHDFRPDEEQMALWPKVSALPQPDGSILSMPMEDIEFKKLKLTRFLALTHGMISSSG